MKKVLITGKNSYVGTSIEKWLMKESDKFYVESISLRDETWKSFDFSKFDIVFHVAGIAHIKETNKNKELYFKVNSDLAVEIAKKAKESGIKEFILMSTMAVYGFVGSLKEVKIIDIETIEKPSTLYGISKYEAEKEIIKLANLDFKIAILRPPMIYGFNSPGNYNRLLNFYKYFAILPRIKNIRSAINIEKFSSSFYKLITSNFYSGIYIFQDEKYFKTNEMLSKDLKSKKVIIYKSRFLAYVIKFLFSKNLLINKIYGNLIYKKNFKFKKIN